MLRDAMSTLDDLRSMEQALADLVGKYNNLPGSNERKELEQMIRSLEAEIARRERHD
jgi:NifB/MoaA-like Fe-S oxidoreductase